MVWRGGPKLSLGALCPEHALPGTLLLSRTCQLGVFIATAVVNVRKHILNPLNRNAVTESSQETSAPVFTFVPTPRQ